MNVDITLNGSNSERFPPIKKNLSYYFPLDEFSNESIANLDVIFIKYGMITKNY